ncbi:glycosyltransferase family 92 protein [Corynebacterium pilbarense]|uniref:Glycosyltransferase family 92 protein n=1 Tax=Corynebacterium pilbarense TaxID=1288393 RepID=A0A9Q4NR98_9CORY|nr:glycosyltransferase family 92 protein [Corynebacterium pilbarense]
MLHILTMSRGDSARLVDWLCYHRSIGFEFFHIVLDNPNDDSYEVIQQASVDYNLTVEVTTLGPQGEYFDCLPSGEKWQRISRWRKDNAQYIAESGLPIVDPLSDRQYKILPGKLSDLKMRFPHDWVAIIDVDEYIALPGIATVKDLVETADKPRLRLLNFNFDMEGWVEGEGVRERTRRWARKDVVAYGKGWDQRVKSIVKLADSLPMVSVHAVSKGAFDVVAPEVARLHHYKFPNQQTPIEYAVEDESLRGWNLSHIDNLSRGE